MQEDYDSEQSKDEQYYNAYSDIAVHELMLSDEPRMNFYRSCINESTVENKIIVDVGAGSGILSYWAAKARAAHVFSIEASSMSSIVSLILADNDMEDTVTVLASTMEDIIEKGVDAFIEDHKTILTGSSGISVIVSEWMGFYLLHEGMLPSVIAAKRFFSDVNEKLHVKTNIEMIPSHGRIYASPMSLAPLKEKILSKWNNVGGINLSRLGLLAYEEKISNSSILVDILPAESLVHEGEIFWEANFGSIYERDIEEIVSTKTFLFDSSPLFKERFESSGDRIVSIDGFAIWFSVSYKENTLSTSPFSLPTHWKQTISLLPSEYRDGAVNFTSLKDSLTLSLSLRLSESCNRCYSITTEIS